MSYVRHGVTVSEDQKKKLVNAIKHNKEVAIRLGYNELTGPNPISITSQQQAKINKAKLQKKGVQLKFSKLSFQNKVGSCLF